MKHSAKDVFDAYGHNWLNSNAIWNCLFCKILLISEVFKCLTWQNNDLVAISVQEWSNDSQNSVKIPQ